jgi:hypothetical protein
MKMSAYAWKSTALLFMTLGARTALADQGIAYAWIPSGSSPSVSAQYSFNPGGGAITVSRLSLGTYNVTFANSGIDTGWSAQATAYGDNANYCNIGSWGGSTITVECFNAGGAAADSAFTVLAVASPSASSSIGNDKNIAFAWADQPTTASYTPPSTYSYNPSGTISISRSSTGTYGVVFNGLNGAGGTVQVTAYGSNASCYSGGWGGSFLANVDCVNAAGSPVDSDFVIDIIPAAVSPTGVAFSWADDPTAASYTPSSTYTYNPTGSATTITRSSTGQYLVTFADLNIVPVFGGNIRATSYVSTARCKVESWGPGSGSTLQVAVGCFNTAGNPADAEYEVLVFPPMGYAYAWIYDGTAASVSSVYSVNPGGGTVTASHNATGNYTVNFPHSGIGTGWAALAVAYGGTANYCKVESWGGGVVNVLCFTAAGVAADSQFTVQAIAGTNQNNIAFAWANQDTSASYTPSAFYTYNPSGSVGITRSAAGSYSVVFNGLNGGGGTVQISAYGSDSTHCFTDGWSGSNFTISVVCANPSATRVDSDFVIAVVPAGTNPPNIAYAWADEDTTASYTPSTTYSYNPSGGAVSVTRSGVGSYTMTFNGLDGAQLTGGDVRVTSYFNVDRCKVGSWGNSGANFSVNINCYSLAGALTDSEYEVLVFTPTIGAPAFISANGGTPQSASVGANFATALSAKVTDVNGNPIGGIAVTFSAPTSGASGTFGGSSTTTATTNSSGVATASTFTANSTAGTYTVTASALGITGTASFSLTNTAVSACSFVISPASITLPPTGTSTVETCPNGSGQPNCGVTPETPRSFSITPSASCGAWTATSSSPFLQITSSTTGTGAGSISYVMLNNTHTTTQNYSITVTSASALATFAVAETGSGDNQVYREVYALYEQLLGRDPDPGGFAFWTGAGGAGLGQMADSFLTSPEAFNSDFVVMATYQAATGAPPDFAQFIAAVTRIRANTETVTSLFNSLIGGGYTATSLYQNLLGRLPTPAEITSANTAGLANWFQTLIGYPNSTTPVSTPNNEFQNTGSFASSPDHSNALYVTMIYFVTLSRDPDPAGLAFWIGIANSGGPGLLFQGNGGFGTRIQILGPGTPNQGFIGSPEFQGLFAN